MQRRDFITLVGSAVAWPLGARAQPAMPVVGFLSIASPVPFAHIVAGLRRGLQDAGFVEGRDVAVEYRWAEGRYDRLPELAADLVHRQVAVIVTSGGDNPSLAAKAATTTIPIVFNVGSDPVKVGLVASLARPGGNATGVNIFTSELAEKRFGLLNDAIPAAASFAVLANPNFPPAMATSEKSKPRAVGWGKTLPSFMPAAKRRSTPLSRAWHSRGRGHCSSLAMRFSTAGASRLWHWPRAMPSRRSTTGANSPKPAAS
jgi:putative ABC transport system substrate-binding protein